MTRQSQGRNVEIVKAFIAGNTNKSELARHFGVSPTTIRRVLSGVMMTLVAATAAEPAKAALQGAELDAANQFIAAHDDMPEYMRKNILEDNNLQTVNNQLQGASYYSQVTYQLVRFDQPDEIHLQPTLTPTLNVPQPKTAEVIPMETLTLAQRTPQPQVTDLAPMATLTAAQKTPPRQTTDVAPMATLTAAQKTPPRQTTDIAPMATLTAAQKTPQRQITDVAPMATLTAAHKVPTRLFSEVAPMATLTPSQQAPVVQQQIRSTYYDDQITALNNQAEQNNAEILSESHARASANEQTLQQSQNYTNQKFSDLKSQVDDNKKQANAGVAGVAAMANIPQVSQNATFSVGAGAGEYASEAGIAVGFSARINHNVVTKATIAGTTADAPVIGAGISAEW